MATLIAFLLSNFTLTLLVLGFIVAAISLWRRPSPVTRLVVVEDLLAYFIQFSIGIS
jgi:multisubunit Na+/H+ antiporter MnhE subunit